VTIKIRYKKLKYGCLSLFLDIHFNGKRWSEFLNLKIKENPSTPIERNERKQVLEFATQIANLRYSEFLSNRFNIEYAKNKPTDFLSFAKLFIDENKLSIEVRCYKAPLKYLKKFTGRDYLYCHEINEVFLQKFANYLSSNLYGLTPSTYFNKIWKIIKAAKAAKLINLELSQPIKIKKISKGIKDVLTIEELKILITTQCSNNYVKNSFLLGALTGLRYCDLKTITWSNVKGNKIVITQQKTKIPITILLSSDAEKFLGIKKIGSDLIFKLPSHTACLKSLKGWILKAGIEKHITFHCARHSFATNLIQNGADIFSVSKLLGHTSLKHTTIYTRYNDDMAKSAIAKLPQLFNNKIEDDATEK
jgi:integrase